MEKPHTDLEESSWTMHLIAWIMPPRGVAAATYRKTVYELSSTSVHGWMTVSECCRHALEKGCLTFFLILCGFPFVIQSDICLTATLTVLHATWPTTECSKFRIKWRVRQLPKATVLEQYWLILQQLLSKTPWPPPNWTDNLTDIHWKCYPP